MANLTAAQIVTAAAAMPSAAEFLTVAKAADQATYRYGKDLTGDNYRTALTATGTPVISGIDANGDKLPALNNSANDVTIKVAGADIVIAPGEQYLTAQGAPQFQTKRYVLESSTGARVELHESILNRLALSTVPVDVELYRSLTDNGAHAPLFSGAIAIGVVCEAVTGQTWKTPRLHQA